MNSDDNNYQEIDNFIRNKIRALKCKRYVPTKNGTCECGRSKERHQNTNTVTTEPWSDNDLIEVPSTTYGKMQLSGFRVIAGKYPKFVRASQTETLYEDLYILMTEFWKFKKPQLIISMNGGAKKMAPLNNDQKLAFKRGLIEVSRAAPTWIVTGGFQFGISKLVGEAAKDYSILSQEQPFTVLGIGSWGAVYNKENLKNKDGFNKIIYNNVEGQLSGKGQAPLDPYHDAFILFDKGIEQRFGLEIEFRTQFEEYVSKRAKCSVVQVIVEGGKNSLITGAEALRAGTPVVVMKGSKRAADVICEVVESSDEIFEDTISMRLVEYKDEWNISTNDHANLEKCLRDYHRCYKSKMVHLFNMRDFKNNLDTAIIEAAFSGTIDNEPLNDDAKLRLAMTFNRSDVAEERICESQTKINFRNYMYPALMKDQWKFVDFFLRQGITVESFLTKKILKDLYFKTDSHNESNYVLREFMESTNHDNLSSIGQLLNELCNDLFPTMYKEKKSNGGCNCCWNNNPVADSQITDDNSTEVKDYIPYIEPIVEDKSDNCCCVSNQEEENVKQYIYTTHPVRNKNNEIIYTEQDLFIWALLTQRIQMAKIFWKCGKDHIGSALIASVICNSLKKKASEKGEMEMMLTLQKVQDEFENLALETLSEAYRRDQTRTHLLLIRALPFWGRESCLDIANKHQQINFLFHSACQTRLNSIWLGGLPPLVNVLQIIANIPFGYLTSLICIFPFMLRGNKNANENAHSEELVHKFNDRGNFNKNIEEVAVSMENSRKQSVKYESSREVYLTKFRQKQKLSYKDLKFCMAMKFFYCAPVTKFVMHIITFMAFLTIFSYVQIVELNSLANSPLPTNRKMEYVVYIFYLSFILGEIRQFSMGGQMSGVKIKFNDWKSSMWNWFDLVIYIIFAIAFVLRCISTVDMVYCRTLYSISLSMFFIRFMEFYYVQKTVGPKVIMISRMMKDLLFFLAIYLIALLAYGTFSLALLYPNVPVNSTLLKNIIYNPFWQLFGQIDLNYMEGSQCLFGSCATPNATVIIANALFLLFANVLLLSLLIAMFGVTFTKVEENSNRVWAFTRYRMIEEFYYRPILPPPFNTFEILYHFVKIMVRAGKKTAKLSIDEFIVNLTNAEDIECSGYEQQCMETYLINNPLFSDSISQDGRKSAVSIISATATSQSDKETPSNIGSHILSLVNTSNEMLKEIQDLQSKVYKIRRLQKKSVKPRPELDS